MPLGDALAAVNASLNAIATALILLGWRAIRRRNVPVHRACMLSALACSTVFLASYLVRLAISGTHRFEGSLGLRLAYLALLSTHVTLAMLVPCLVGRTAYLALRGRIEEHRRIARWALPAWLYVSATGVLVYFMLYHVSR